MAHQSLLGTRLVENFNTLLEYSPSKECSHHVNEHMFLRPDKRSFFIVMSYLLDLIDPCWKAKIPEIILTKQDERLFFNGLCQYLKVLKKDYPEVGLPTLTPSSMVCFSGDKSREVLLKISNALMLRIMKEENFDMDGTEAENLNEYENICEANCKLRNAIDNILKQNAQGITLYINIISMIISVWPWNDVLKTRLINLDDTSVISDIQNENTKLFIKLKVLSEKLQPYFDHFSHDANGETCSCPEMYHYSSDVFSNCCDLLCKFHKNVTETHLRNLKCIAAVKAFRIENRMDGFDKINFDEKMHYELVNKLESKICGYFKGDIHADKNDIYLPLTVESCSSPEIIGFSPVIACDWLNVKKQTIKLKVQSLSENLAPVKIDISPIDNLNSHILSHTATKQSLRDESVSTILQRLRSKATPLKFSKGNNTSIINLQSSISYSTSSGFVSKECLTSRKIFRNSERFTPITKPLKSISQSTNRRQSMGFVKPSTCLVRKKLPSSQISEKTKLNSPTAEAGKSKDQNIIHTQRRADLVDVITEERTGLLHNDQSTGDQLPSSSKSRMFQESPVSEQNKTVSDVQCGKPYEYREMKSDCGLDSIVQKMIEDESSSFSDTSGFLDSSLSGVECLPSLHYVKSLNFDREDAVDPEEGSPQKASDMSAIVSEIISIDNEFNRSINNIRDEESSILKSNSDISSDESEDLTEPATVTQAPRKSRVEQLAQPKVKSGRDSLGLLIERFTAIKKNCNM